MRFLKRIIRFFLKALYGCEVYNTAALQAPGPIMLIPNHLSWFDWLFIAAYLDEDWKFVTSSTAAQMTFLHRYIMINRYTFPIDVTSPYSLKHIAEFLKSGGRLVIFAEGRLSRTGSLMKIFDGSGLLLSETGASVITAYLRGAQRLPFSPHPGWRQWFPKVTVHFSPKLTPPQFASHNKAQERERLTQWLRAELIKLQFTTEQQLSPETLPAAILYAARIQPQKIVLQDITDHKINYRRLIIGANLLARRWNFSHQERIGMLLPNTNAFPLVLLSLWQAGYIPTILNYSSGAAVILNCTQLANLRHIITARAFIEKAKLNLELLQNAGINFIYLEDIRADISHAERFGALLVNILRSPVPNRDITPSDTAVILFTSGSEGIPKGVELSHANILANIRQMLVSTDIMDNDRVFNALPLFHSFGLSVGLLLPLVRGLFTYLYPSPLHYRLVPTMVYAHDCTIMFGTNTFLQGYGQKAHPYDFRQVRYLFAGAEKLQETTFNLYAHKFGVSILEGYGITECSPVLSANLPMNLRFGTVGQFFPGIEARLESIAGVADGGRLFVRGPNIMKGYLNQEADRTFQSLNGWYDTGDIVQIDADGFVHILGRLKRFAKISGEMVSLTAIEDALAGAFPQYGLRFQIALISVADQQKGEALIAVTNDARLTVNEIRTVIKSKGFSNLCVPREIRNVREIPKLGSGKINYRELTALLS